MSQVYMCDMCSAMFSVNQAGWKQMQESISVHENNAFNHGSRTLHMCPECAPTGRVRQMAPSIAVDKRDSVVVELDPAPKPEPLSDVDSLEYDENGNSKLYGGECKKCFAPAFRDDLCASRVYTGSCE